jgi:thiamine-monophosphate kinase
MRQRNSSEDSIVGRIYAQFARDKPRITGSAVHVGIGDDAALFQPKYGHEIILTCDWFLEGTHFQREKHPADSVGWKCLARAISDVAAIGGMPRCFLLSLALPQSHTGYWLDAFLGGLRRASRKFACPLAGGDTTQRKEILINITVVGDIHKGRAVLRTGALAGDIIYVSGQLGEAELGLGILRSSKRRTRQSNPFLKRHLYPEPRLELGRWLAETRLATSMMDLSDGLSSDLLRLCTASGVGARLESAKLPIVQLLKVARNRGVDSMQLALHGGDDYELLFTVRPNTANLVPQTLHGVPLTAIGTITKKRGVILLKKNGDASRLISSGWDPFRSKR